MTISSSANRNDYTGNDTTATYNYSYKIFAEGDLTVTVLDPNTNVETTLTITTDYTVTGVGETSGGTIVLVDAGQAWMSASSYLETSYDLTIRRVVGLTQETDIRNQGDFYPEAHEDQFDKLTMIDQQQQDEIDRSVKLPETIASSVFDPTLPTTITTGSLSLVINSAGDGFETGPTTTEIANAQTYATNASTSASAAAASETAAAASAAAAAASAVEIAPTIAAAQSIASGGQVSLTASKWHQYVRVAGNAGAQTASNTPFDITLTQDAIVGLIGTDNTNTLTVNNNDAAGGCLINGASVTLGLNDIITFIYDQTEDRYIELSRNF